MCWVYPNQPFAWAALLRPVRFSSSSRRSAFPIPRAPTLSSLLVALFIAGANALRAADLPAAGIASWYGEEHRGRLMANGRRFDPEKCTAASWFYPLGTKVRVTLRAPDALPRSVLVTVTDRGPARELVHDGRIIDLAHGAFRKIAHPGKGLVAVTVSLIE